MKDETRIWSIYAGENLESSKILLESRLYNPCLQNIQQAVEKALKSIFIEKSIKLQRTHDILELKQVLLKHNIEIELFDDECDFLNSIYLPSKYPIGSVLADYEPDEGICREGIEIAEKTLRTVKSIIE
ncbi:MAG: HEPN domain-containing protein [candidate division KSB1 bacterium]|nr:HEPN domain-containing protein [candidate division KSB1 bacterium]